MVRCKYIYKNGQLKGKQCPHEALPGSDFCIWHEPKDGKDFSGQEIQETALAEAYLVYAKFLKTKFAYYTDLRYAHLQEANLDSANIQVAYLGSAELQRAYLIDANLQEANLRYANLQKADLSHANLQKANLRYAHLQEADLDSANLQKADLSHAELQRAYLIDANLQEANLSHANLQKADLSHAELQQVYLGSAELQRAYLIDANLQEANLRYANLQKANLRYANLQKANLRYAHLQEADLKSANLQGVDLSYTDLTNTLFDSKTDLRGVFLYTTEIKNAKGMQYAKISGRNVGEQCVEEFIADKLDRVLNSKKNFEKVLEEILPPELRTLGFTDEADKIVISHIAKWTDFNFQYIINSKGKISKYKEIYIVDSKGKISKYKEIKHSKEIKHRIDLYKEAIDIYVNLKNYFKNAGFYNESGIFFIGEFRVRGKIYRALGNKFAYELRERVQHISSNLVFWKHYEEIGKVPLNEKKSGILFTEMLKNYFLFFTNKLLSITSLYGESIGRVLLTAFFIIFVYGGIYSLTGAVISSNMAHPTHNFLTSLYFSIVTFTTLGYGDLHPVSSTTLRLTAGSEAFLGAFLLAYFVVVVSRKIMR